MLVDPRDCKEAPLGKSHGERSDLDRILVALASKDSTKNELEFL